jgi:hypothetical protein
VVAVRRGGGGGAVRGVSGVRGILGLVGQYVGKDWWVGGGWTLGCSPGGLNC